MVGGGVKPGMTHGETDDMGYNVVKDPVHVHDFQATVMHLMGIDHERLTFKYQGRRFRTDVHGQVVKEIGMSRLQMIPRIQFQSRPVARRECLWLCNLSHHLISHLGLLGLLLFGLVTPVPARACFLQSRYSPYLVGPLLHLSRTRCLGS